MNLKQYIDATNNNLNYAINIIEWNNHNLSYFKEKINKNKFKKYILFIWWTQIKWSFSPFIHTYSSMWLGDFLYTLLDFSKEWLILSDVLKYIENNDNIVWANITMPYKIDTYQILKNNNRLDKSALLVWAVNTITKDNWKIYWYNTDFEGILLPIKLKLSKSEIKNINKWYIIWGWWAAKAWITALLILWITDIVILNRNTNLDLIEHFNNPIVKNLLINDYWINKKINIIYKKYDIINNDKISDIIVDKWILINTLPFWFNNDLPKKAINRDEVNKIQKNIKLFFDVVYDIKHWDTPLIKDFKSSNILVCDWIDMLIWQASKWFWLWTNWWEIDIKKINSLLR